jgi:hypothetical protein
MIPMTKAPVGSTNPHAGVMATSPDTAPESMPSTLDCLRTEASSSIHEMEAAAVQICVFSSAMPALKPAVRAEPALKPILVQYCAAGLVLTMMHGTVCM